MYNRTLNRPMFRRGGRAGGGIMTGVDRQGYAGEDGKQIVVDNDPMKDLGDKVKQRYEMMESITPKYPYKASDFFMGLGANILAAPGGNPILQTIGTAAKDPLNLMMKQNIAEYGNKRDTIQEIFKNLTDEEQDAYYKRAQMMVEQDPERFPDVKAALKILLPDPTLYRKDQSPEETLREANIAAEKAEQNAINSIKSQYKGSAAFSEGISDTDARTIYNFEKNIAAGKYEGVYHDPNQLFIDDSEVGRGTTEAEKRLIIRDYNPEQTDYKEGRIYVDFITKKAYVKQGQYFIPYEDYISETIKTD
jgi:hypothetical protein